MDRFADRSEALAAARLRASVQAARMGGVPARTRGRRAGRLAPLPDGDLAAGPWIDLLRAPDRRAEALRRAGAIRVGNEIAMLVTPLARAALIAAMGDDLRRLAVANRRLARPAETAPVAQDAAALADPVLAAWSAAETHVAWAWAAELPAPLDTELAPDLSEDPPGPAERPHLLACLTAALDSGIPHG